MRFLVDMPLSPDLAAWLRSIGHDAVHASELSMNRSEDEEILNVAASQDRIVVTADLDFPRLFASLDRAAPGLVLLRGGNYSELESYDCLRRVLLAVGESELMTSVVVVDRERIRKRHLPLSD